MPEILVFGKRSPRPDSIADTLVNYNVYYSREIILPTAIFFLRILDENRTNYRFPIFLSRSRSLCSTDRLALSNSSNRNRRYAWYVYINRWYGYRNAKYPLESKTIASYSREHFSSRPEWLSESIAGSSASDTRAIYSPMDTKSYYYRTVTFRTRNSTCELSLVPQTPLDLEESNENRLALIFVCRIFSLLLFGIVPTNKENYVKFELRWTKGNGAPWSS